MSFLLVRFKLNQDVVYNSVSKGKDILSTIAQAYLSEMTLAAMTDADLFFKVCT